MRVAIAACLLLFLPLCGFGQERLYNPDGVFIPLQQAYNIDFWGRKGIESRSLVRTIDSMEVEMSLLMHSKEIYSVVNNNYKSAIQQYRDRLQECATASAATTMDLIATKKSLEVWKKKAKKRGTIIAAGAAALAAAAYLSIQL